MCSAAETWLSWHGVACQFVLHPTCVGNVGTALHLCSRTMMETEEGRLSRMLLWENCNNKFQSCSSVSLWHTHLHYLTQSVFALALRTTQASQLLSHFSQGVESFSDFSDCGASSYVHHREKYLFFSNERPSFLSCLFYITFEHFFFCTMYMLPSHKQGKKKYPKHKWNKKSNLFDFGVRAWHKCTEECI